VKQSVQAEAHWRAVRDRAAREIADAVRVAKAGTRPEAPRNEWDWRESRASIEADLRMEYDRLRSAGWRISAEAARKLAYDQACEACRDAVARLNVDG